jgi:hypothetical protein
MEKLSNLIKNNPKFQSNRGEYLKLAIKEGDAVRSTGKHYVKLIGCENAINKDYRTQKEKKGINLLFEENGQPKKYFVPTLGDDGKFHYLIERFAEIEEGTELILEYKRKEGSVRGFIDVQVVGEEKVEQPTGEKEIPIVEDEEYGTLEEEENLTEDVEIL